MSAAVSALPLVRVRGLGKSFGLHRVLDGIDLDMHEGEVTVVLGPSGSGKSTLLRCVNHLEKPDAGFVEVGGDLIGYRYERGKLHELRRAQITRQRARIGMVFQQFNLFGHMTALENIIEGPLAAGTARKQAVTRASELLARVGLAGREGSYPRQMSGGQQQRVAIARALVNQPALLLADEPTGNLDSQNAAEFMTLLTRLRAERGMTVVLASHDLQIAARSERLIRLRDGVLTEDIDLTEGYPAQDVIRRATQLG